VKQEEDIKTEGIRQQASGIGEEKKRPKRERGLRGGNGVQENGESNEVAIEIKGVTYTYGWSREPAVQDVTLRVGFGERLGILGPNGGGKTTLIKLLLGLLSPSNGHIEVYGLTPTEARTRGLIGYVPQRSEAELAFPLSARQVVVMGARKAEGIRDQGSGIREDNKRPKRKRGLRREPNGTTAAIDRIDEALEVTGALAYAHHPIGTLSGGQVQRVMIARALAAAPKILVMDEPTVGVDLAGQVQFAELLRTARQRFGLTIVIVSHDVKAIAATCDHVACLSRTLHSHIAPEGLTPEVLAEVFQHDVAAVFGDVHVHAHRAEDCADPSHGADHDGGHGGGHGGSASLPHSEKGGDGANT